ncbi:MAG TPA: 23S rRNA (uridine(2552)-2'-O)-methyltransferase RlmE [Gammaproteobacteria bacterium]|nr:23S rRNA (uridine(2552)-2'-O)-methyltransferase RlmE [Gammaproteobacteria bacterium]
MAKSKSSHRWLDEHENDEYVQRARAEGWRGRAVYKLSELDQRYKLIRPGMSVVDLGAAPGSWSEYVARILDGRGSVLATDILPMDAIAGVTFIQGDFREQAVLDALLEALGQDRADLVISDMAPNMSGMSSVDIPAAMYLAELAADMAARTLKPGGGFLVKLFQGEGFDELVGGLRRDYQTVIVRKPKASRPRSREVYALARGRKL